MDAQEQVDRSRYKNESAGETAKSIAEESSAALPCTLIHGWRDFRFYEVCAQLYRRLAARART